MKTRVNILTLIIGYEVELDKMRKDAAAIDVDSDSHSYEQWQVAIVEIKAKEKVVNDLLTALL